MLTIEAVCSPRQAHFSRRTPAGWAVETAWTGRASARTTMSTSSLTVPSWGCGFGIEIPDHLLRWLEKIISARKCEERVKTCNFCAKLSMCNINQINVLLSAIHRSTVECEHACLARLSWVNGHSFGNLVAQVYRYQHLCYFKRERFPPLPEGGTRMRN